MKKILLLAMAVVLMTLAAYGGECCTTYNAEEVPLSGHGERAYLKVELPEYKDVSMKVTSAVYNPERKMITIKGVVKNRTRSMLAGVDVHAELMDKNGKLLAQRFERVVPNVIRMTGARLGRFTMVVCCDPGLDAIKFNVSWSGKVCPSFCTNIGCR